HIVATARRIAGLETDAVIIGIDVTARDMHLLAVDHIDAVIVPVGRTIDPHMLQREMRAFGIGLYPAGGVLKRNIPDADAVTVFEVDKAGPVILRRTHLVPGILML